MIEDLLKSWLLADAKIEKIKLAMSDMKSDLADAEKEAETAKFSIQEEMAETGEYEIKIEGEFCDYRVYFTAPRSSIKAPDPDAVPDEFCKMERIPKLTEIKEYLSSVDTLPNWAAIEMSTPKLTYKIHKKKG